MSTADDLRAFRAHMGQPSTPLGLLLEKAANELDRLNGITVYTNETVDYEKYGQTKFDDLFDK